MKVSPSGIPPEVKPFLNGAESIWTGRTRVDHTRQSFVGGLPVQETERVQLGPGRERYESLRLMGRDLVMMMWKIFPKVTVHTVPQPGWSGFIIPINWQSEMVFNGYLARPYDVFFTRGRSGYTSTSENRFNIALVIRESRLVRVCSALLGVDEEDIDLSDRVLPMDKAAGERLHRILLEIASQSHRIRWPDGFFQISETLENDVICMMAEQLGSSATQAQEPNIFRVDALRVVRTAATAAFTLRAGSLGDLCRAAGVSQRWLHKCFVDVVGVSPYRYLQMARLTRARDLLLDGDITPATVKSVALTVGYRQSGRFAAEYRALHGENPSDTLRRAGRG